MEIHFEKYQALGNNFILVNQLENKNRFKNKKISFLCDRNHGIGADGIIIIKKCLKADFEIVYYNSDGSKSFCGNGSRCAVDFAIKKKLTKKKNIYFLAYDGYHFAKQKGDFISIKMNDIKKIKKFNNDYYINSGAPHYIKIVENLKNIDINKKVDEIKSKSGYVSQRFNLNFVQIINKNKIEIRTYEKGVERETQSCGSGAIAGAIAASFNDIKSPVIVESNGGCLKTIFEKKKNFFENVFLEGKQKFIFSGKITI